MDAKAQRARLKGMRPCRGTPEKQGRGWPRRICPFARVQRRGKARDGGGATWGGGCDRRGASGSDVRTAVRGRRTATCTRAD